MSRSSRVYLGFYLGGQTRVTSRQYGFVLPLELEGGQGCFSRWVDYLHFRDIGTFFA